MDLINRADSPQRQNEKLQIIVNALIQRAEQSSDQSGIAYAQFERAALLEAQVRERTGDLEHALDLLHESNRALARANEASENAWSNLRLATETIPDGIALFDSDDRLVLFNRRFCCEIPDVSDALGIGLTFSEYLKIISHSRFLDVSEHGSPEKWVDWRKIQHRKSPVRFNINIVGGSLLQIQSQRTVSGSTVILHTDVTKIVQLERDKAMEQQVRLLRTTLDHLDQGVCIFDPTGTCVGWNSRLDSLLAMPDSHALSDQRLPTLLDSMQGRVKPVGDFSFDTLKGWAAPQIGRPPMTFELTTSTGTILSVFGQEMPDQGFVLSFSDVTADREAGKMLSQMNELLEQRVAERTTELNQALAAAKRANASKSRFVAAASHDLAQPLSAAKLFIASLADGGDSQQVADVARKAETALHSVEHIIEALLDMSRLDSHHATFDRRPVPLNAVLTALKNELGLKASAKGLDFSVVGCSLVVDSDPGFLRRILQNLITNAVRYTDRGKVLVGVRRRGGMARIEVHDTGRGISPDQQKTVFEEFRQLDHGRDDSRGLGLGLAIVERACTALGHPLDLWSEPGTGSCFAFEVPVVSEFIAPPKATSGDAPATEAISGLVVLQVVTDPHLSRALSMLIEGWGGIVLDVTAVDEAMALLKDVDLIPDALVLDGRLTDGQTGLEVYDFVRQLHGPLPTRIITADRSEALLTRCVERQIKIIPKPIDPAKLIDFLTGIKTGTSPGAAVFDN